MARSSVDDTDSVAKGKQVSRYRKVEVRTWGDERFRALSPMPPSGQGLWLFLITGPHTGPIPGLFRAGQAAMAEELGWDLEAFREAFREVFREGMAKADFQARVMWVPKAIKHNPPASPNVVKSWAAEFDLIPECDLKREAFEGLKASIHALGEAFGKAFDESFVKPSAKPFGKPSPKPLGNQEQEQEQDWEKEKEQEHLTTLAALAPSGGYLAQPAEPAFELAAGPGKPAAKRAARARAEKPAKAPPPSAETWDAYADAYRNRYGTDPVRNAQVNAQLSQLVGKLGALEAPLVAAFYVGHNGAFYVRSMHDTSLLLRDAAALRTQWATRRTVTATQAQQADRTQTNANAFAPLIAAARAREAAQANTVNADHEDAA